MTRCLSRHGSGSGGHKNAHFTFEILSRLRESPATLPYTSHYFLESFTLTDAKLFVDTVNAAGSVGL